MERSILHLDLDTFFVSVERLLDSSLHGKPVIAGGLSERSVVASCSYECRTFGVHAGMPIKMALRLCPEAVVRSGNMRLYGYYSQLVTEIIASRVPVCEKASIDEHYADLTGMERFFGCMKWAQQLRAEIIRETGLPISFGLSPTKTVSKIATGQAKPNGELYVPASGVQDFLAPLPVQKIPGVGEKTLEALRRMGVRTIAQLAAMPSGVLQHAFGKYGEDLLLKAQGRDTTAVIPRTEQKSMSTERTFDTDLSDERQLHTILASMTERLAFDLRKSDKLTACVGIKIRYADFETRVMQTTLKPTDMDHLLAEAVRDLFDRLYNRHQKLRLVGVRFSNLSSSARQLSLFDNTRRNMRLYSALDGLRTRYGARIVGRGVAFKAQDMLSVAWSRS